MNVAIANLTSALVPLGFLLLGGFLYHESHANGWATFWCCVAAALLRVNYETVWKGNKS